MELENNDVKRGVTSSNSDMKVSIVTVCYNSAKDIEQTILSIVNLNYDNIEYIVIDGASTDGTVDIIKKYAEGGSESRKHRHHISKWVSEPDKGIYDAMNKGIAAATGDYIINMNAGDKLLDIPVKCLEEAQRKKYAGVCGCIVDEYGKVYRPEFNYKVRLYNTLPHQALFYNRQKMGRYDLQYKIVSDYDYNLNMFLSREKILLSNTVVAVHSFDGISNSPEAGKEALRVIKKRCGAFWLFASYMNCKLNGLKYRLGIR